MPETDDWDDDDEGQPGEPDYDDDDEDYYKKIALPGEVQVANYADETDEDDNEQDQKDKPESFRGYRVLSDNPRRSGSDSRLQPTNRQQLNARQRRKFRRLNEHRAGAGASLDKETVVSGMDSNDTEAPILHDAYAGRVVEGERVVELSPKLRILNQVEVCDIELFPLTQSDQRLPFMVSWLDRVQGEASLEARKEEVMDCETQGNYTFKMRAIGCNGLQSNE